MQIIISLTGLDGVQERLSKLGASLHDFTAALETLGKQLILFYSNNVFISQGQAIDKPWQPLSSSTQAYKASHWPGRGPLIRTGALQQGFESTVTPASLFITNRVPYFPYQQQGTTPGTGRGHNIPARPMLGVNATVESMIKTVLEADIKAKIAGTNL
jgi:phage gpG-like protein